MVDEATLSPSTRREWIEINFRNLSVAYDGGLPPHGGSGLKYKDDFYTTGTVFVSLHTEGVD